MQASDYFALVTARKLPVVIDDPAVGDMVRDHGFDAIHYDDFDFLQPHDNPVLVLITQLAYHDRLNELWEQTQDVVSHIALAKFDNSLDCVRYSFEQMLSADHDDTLGRRADYYAKLLACDHVEVETDAGVVTCRFADEVEVANHDDDMEVGWLYSAAEFFEASIVNVEADRSSFTVDGDYAFDGMLFLANTPAIKANHGAFVDDLRRRAVGGDNHVRWVDNCIQRIVVGGRDATEPFLDMVMGKERQNSATEFAVGCVEYPRAPDWTVNSVINEGTHGVHIGIGMGIELPHLDFVSTRAQLRFPPRQDSASA